MDENRPQQPQQFPDQPQSAQFYQQQQSQSQPQYFDAQQQWYSPGAPNAQYPQNPHIPPNAQYPPYTQFPPNGQFPPGGPAFPPNGPAPRKNGVKTVVAIVAVLLVLALVAGGVFWWMSSKNQQPTQAGDFVSDIPSQPETSWTFELPEAEIMGYAQMPESRVMVYDNSPEVINPTFFMLDLASGEQLWSATADVPDAPARLSCTEPRAMPGTDLLSVTCFDLDDRAESDMVLLKQDSGETVDTVSLAQGQLIFTATSGNAYLLDVLNESFSRIQSITEPDQIVWTVDTGLSSVIADILNSQANDPGILSAYGVVEDGDDVYLGSGLPTPKYFSFAASQKDGTVPDWGVFNGFGMVDGVVVVDSDTTIAGYRGDQQLWMLDKDEIAQSPDSSVYTQLRNTHLFVTTSSVLGDEPVDSDTALASTISQINPQTGEIQWTQSVEGAGHVLLNEAGQQFVFLALDLNGTWLGVLNPEDGSIRFETSKTEYSSFYIGQELVYTATDNRDQEQESTLSAYSYDSADPVWTQTFPTGSEVVRVGNSMVLIDAQLHTISGLEAR